MKAFSTLSWSRIETAWHTLRSRRRAAELERALILQQLRDHSPWLDRQRFASKAACDELADYTFTDVVRYRLHEGTAEVRNTLRVLDTFDSDAFERYGRDVLLRVCNRVENTRDRMRILKDLDKLIKKTGRPPSTTHVSMVIDKFAPRKRRSNTIDMVRKLQEKLGEARRRVKELEKENAQLKSDLAKTQRKSGRRSAS